MQQLCHRTGPVALDLRESKPGCRGPATARRNVYSHRSHRGRVTAVSDALVSLQRQASGISFSGCASKLGCLVTVAMSGTLECLQGPVRFRSHHVLTEGMFTPWCQSLGFSMVACKLALPLLGALRQPIRSTGPASHFTKSGTPTAAGAVFIPLACAVTLAYTTTPRVVIACALILVASIVGLLDDYFTVNPRSVECRGLSATEQLAMQLLSGIVLATAAIHFIPGHLISSASVGRVTSIKLHVAPWLSVALPPTIYQLLCAFTYVSEVNAVNLTDGLDGLAASCTALVLSGIGMGLHGTFCQDLQVLCACLSGAVCGFYTLNRHPAASFMGNCGSHGLGAAIAIVAALGGAHGVVAWLSIVLAIEAGSTALQLGWFAWTQRRRGEGQRLFRMAPLHHHLEMCGWHEVAIVALATAVQGILVAVAVAVR